MLNYLNNYTRVLKKNFLPPWITFFVTNKCNLSCAHCFYKEKLNKDIKELSLEEIKKISSSLDEVHKLFISGGEPFLRADLKEICEIFYNQNMTRLIYIPTNGLLIDKIMKDVSYLSKSCKDAKLTITFSLEGTQELNDSVRGHGTFKKVMQNLRHICAMKKELNNVRIFVSSTITSLNSKDILSLFYLLKNEVGIDYHCCDPVRNLSSSKNPLFLLHPEDWKRLTDKTSYFDEYYFKKSNEKGLKLICHLLAKKYIYKIQRNCLESKPWPFKCQAGHLFGIIEPEGDVKLCELIDKAIGNLRDVNYDFRKIWRSRDAEIMRTRIAKDAAPMCHGCTMGCPLVWSLISNPPHLFKAITGLH